VEEYFAKMLKTSHPERLLTIGRVANLTVDHNGRSKCQYRDRCQRGCPYGAYFSSLSSTLPAAAATRNMSLISDSIVTEIIYNEKTRRGEGVRVINTVTGQDQEYSSKLIFLNASSFNSAFILLNSKSNRFPNGMGNDSGELGCNVMDHYIGGGASAETELFKDKYYRGRRPNGIHIPRFQNVNDDNKSRDYIRGFQYGGGGVKIKLVEEYWRGKNSGSI